MVYLEFFINRKHGKLEELMNNINKSNVPLHITLLQH